MTRRLLQSLFCIVLVAGVAWSGRLVFEEKSEARAKWEDVGSGVLRSRGNPAAYVLRHLDAAIAIDCPAGADIAALKQHGISKIELVLLTHHHRDTVALADKFIQDKVPVRAPKASAEWLHPEPLAKYWQESIPLRNSRTAYLVVPVGNAGIDCSLEDGQALQWRGWELTVVATPGHSRDHVSYFAKRAGEPTLLFAGDALASEGKLWTPYTTEWDHWTDSGLKAAAESLRKLATLKPDMIFPAHGQPIKINPATVLNRTAEAVAEVGFLKSYERYTKERLGNPPQYKFLAKEQAGSAGEKPWSQLSEHLFYTGNTYVLVAQDKSLMVYDPWGKRSVEQIEKLRKDRNLGPVELVMFSHAHFDHYDGVYELPDRNRYEVWALEQVALPIANPLQLRAPFLDIRPERFDRRFHDNESATWKEYTFTFHHFPGQTEFAMAVEATIDSKRCVFTGDNFFHVDLYSGTGGWMGLNWTNPLNYASSAGKLLRFQPDWVLAEHGGAFEFNLEDVRRRMKWGEAANEAALAISPLPSHGHSWNPHSLHVSPILLKGRPGQVVQATVVNSLFPKYNAPFPVPGRGVFADVKWARGDDRQWGSTQDIRMRILLDAPKGRHVFPLRVVYFDGIEDSADAFVVVDVEP